MSREASHSGLVRSLGKRVYRKVSEVRILPPPFLKSKLPLAGIFDFKYLGSVGGFEPEHHPVVER